MFIRVLGSAAGGGFPQWNCNCDNCAGLRAGTIRATARSQSSIAVSSDGESWALINASPDIRDQIARFPGLQPTTGRRGTGIRGVVLMDAQIDHTTGLLILREGDPLQLYCTDMVYEDLTTGFPVLSMLGHYCGVEWHKLALTGEKFEVDGVEDISFQAIELSSKAPPYSPHRHDPHPGDNIGLIIEDRTSGNRAFYAPGLGEVDTTVKEIMKTSRCLLVDGTFWTEDEMLRRGVGKKLASQMGHLAQSGDHGMLEHLDAIENVRKVLIHINNTNPILVEDSPERGELDKRNIEVAFDGMEILV